MSAQILKPTIAIYKTNEGGEVPINFIIRHLAAEYGAVTQYVTGSQICDGYLAQDHVRGIVFPGRERGNDYFKEMKLKGLQSVQDETRNGLNVMAICAGSYILSKEIHWHNKNADQSLIVKSPYPLFQGRSEGIISDLYPDSYFASSSKEQRNGTGLPASIVKVASPENPNTSFSVQYAGGGRFIPDQDTSFKTLLLHQQTKDKTPAAIEFSYGDGLVHLHSAHPEVCNRLFNEVFKKSHRAVTMPEIFKNDLKALEDSQAARTDLFRDFVQASFKKAAHSRTKQKIYAFNPSMIAKTAMVG